MSPSFEPSIPPTPTKRKIENVKNLTIRNIAGQIIADNTQVFCAFVLCLRHKSLTTQRENLIRSF